MKLRAFADWLDAMKYDRPIAYHLMMIVFGLAALIIVFLILPDGPLLRAMGVMDAQKRAGAVANGMFWSSRAAMHQSPTPEKPVVMYGNMEGVDASGKIIFSVASGTKYERSAYKLADTSILDLYGLAQYIGALRLEDVKFEVYSGNQAVIWVRHTPLNVKLIEAGIAKPDPNPPTNIVDEAFAAYYWAIAKGGS